MNANGDLDLTPVAVYVPATSGPIAALIDAGSGVVGSPNEAGRVTVDYEGNRYGARNLHTWADRVSCAWGRHSVSYPTVARSVVEPNAVVHVGWYDPRTGDVTLEPDHTATVAAWLGASPEDLDAQCHTTNVRHETRRALLKMRQDPAKRVEADFLAKRLRMEL